MNCRMIMPVMAVLLMPALCSAQAQSSGAVAPFTIRVSDAVLQDLDERLARTRFPDEIPGVGWARGTPLAYLRPLIEYWRNSFDWREQERRLNAFQQFTAAIDGVNLHFIHQRSRHPNAMPLLITHGWPGSVVEFEKIIGPLTDPTAHGGDAADAFHVIAPSLPGFGFSGHPTETGWNPTRISDALAQLMARLGYSRYGAQGGDWGGIINTQLALGHADKLTGLHLNFCTGGGGATEGLPQAELDRIRRRQEERADDGAYSQIQGTRPQTLGYGLNDSPAGTAAWIVEKFFTWSDVAQSPEEKFTKDELLTNITLYWVTATQTSSAQIYYENSHAANRRTGRVEVPTACAVFPKEIFYAPRRVIEDRYNLVRWTEMPRGGHFAAMEEPALLVDDIRAFFRDLR